MSRAEANWERLVRAALRGDRLAGGYGHPTNGIAGVVPSSLGNNVHIEEVLRAADEIQDEDPTVARILCEHAYSLAQNLDPNSEGRGVLQFKTGLMSVIRQKLAKRDGGAIDRSQDIAKLQEFYKLYREKHKVDELIEDEMKLRESAVFSGNLGELERKTLKRKKVLATLKVLWSVIEDMTKEISPEDAKNLISEEMKKVMQKDAARTEDVVPYNIIPLDALSSTTNAIVTFPEVRAAISILQYHRDVPRLPDTFSVPDGRNSDMLDLLQCVFGFQEGNVKNQREHIIHLLANEQSRVGKPSGNEPKIDDGAVHVVFSKALDNYIKWCNYLPIHPIWNNTDSLTKEKKLLYVCLYYLMWGEAANVRFLPEGLCYIFHHLARELEEILRNQTAEPAKSCISDGSVSFLENVISPLYDVIAAEAANNKNGRAPHSAWRNYDDFNEFFWSLKCFTLEWPWKLSNPFFSKPSRKKKGLLGRNHHYGKTSFVEHRTFLHLYHSFHRLWIFLIMMFQALTIIAFNNGSFNMKTVLELFSLGPTYVAMKFIESLLDILMMYGAYSTSRGPAITRVLWRFCWFTMASLVICYLYVKALQDGTQSAAFKIYGVVIGAYFGVKIIMSLLTSVPCCHGLTEACYRWSAVRLVKWMHQENNYVGRGMHESPLDYIKYVAFWIVILGAKFSFTYFLQIKPLVKPTRTVINFRGLQYAWHDFVSKNNHNAITILCLWAPVVSIYLLDIHVFYTVMSAIYGFLLGARDRLGEIRSVEAVHRFFEKFPGIFMEKLHIAIPKRKQLQSSGQLTELDKLDASRFAPFWNEIVRNLREEDYINNAELELLLMPKNDGVLPIVQWPLFLLASKVFLAKDIAADYNESQDELWVRVSKDQYMNYAVVECFHSIYYILRSILDNEGRLWVEKIYGGIQESISKKNIKSDLHFEKLHIVIAKLVAVLGILRGTAESNDLKKGAVNAIQDLYEVVHHEVFSVDMSGNLDEWTQINRARAEGRLFNNLKWPNDPRLKDLIKRLYSLLTIKESAASVPKNLEARRRLQFFTNSLFMRMPMARPASETLSFSVFTPYYSEIVLYSMAELQKKNEDGITTLFYLQKIYPDEWRNFLTRINRDENAADSELFGNPNDILELRLWASYRGQTLARTVRGMMYYRKALMLQSYLERIQSEDLESTIPLAGSADTHFELSPEARAQADLKFTYVVTCQIYGKQKGEGKPEAADIALLMQRNEALRVAYIDEVESVKNGKPSTEYYSKLVKADIHGKDKEIYSIKLPGNPKLGEGKPENQNHAIIFTRGNAVQTIDMNQDNYFEEALKMRNLLEEFSQKRGKHYPSILGVREHVFTGSVSSLASFMSNQETSFVTLGQRVLSNPLKVRMHYGHPDVFDRIFHITRGGISKASRSINISEDIYAGFNSTLRQGSITHHEYIQKKQGYVSRRGHNNKKKKNHGNHRRVGLGRQHPLDSNTSEVDFIPSDNSSRTEALMRHPPTNMLMKSLKPSSYDPASAGNRQKQTETAPHREGHRHAGPFVVVLLQNHTPPDRVTPHAMRDLYGYSWLICSWIICLVGKGRDVGLNQIAVFEGKVAGGNGEQVLSRDIYRLGQLFDFFRMLSFYVTTVGFYLCTMLTVLTVYIFLYGKTYLALSGVGESIQNRADILQNTALNTALNTQFLFQIGVFTAVPMILGFILESGVLTAFVQFITMQFQLCSVFFTFSLGTRTHYFGRAILHGGAKYRATGRGFVVRHIKFAENYRLYSRSHFVKGMEVALLLIIFLAYGFNNGGAVGYILLSISSWFMVLSWLFAPYLFNPSGFEWQKLVEDFRDWTNWLFYRGGIGVKGEESWEAWWEEELQHIYTIRGRILETILSLRFFIFQYGVVYHMSASGESTALSVYWISWAVLGGLFVLLLVFGLNPKAMVHFQLLLRLVKSIALLLVLAGLIVATVFTALSVGDVFASILAFVPTGWGILSIVVAWKPIVKKLGLWKTARSLARLYDAGMGMIIFVPIAICSWFPFISTFQTRLLFNQAFSRGLEISLILAGNNPNAGM